MPADCARRQPRPWNGAHWPCPRRVTEAIACPADPYVGLRFNQPSAWAMGSPGLGIVSNRLIGDDGARPEVGWVPRRWTNAQFRFSPRKAYGIVPLGSGTAVLRQGL